MYTENVFRVDIAILVIFGTWLCFCMHWNAVYMCSAGKYFSLLIIANSTLLKFCACVWYFNLGKIFFFLDYLIFLGGGWGVGADKNMPCIPRKVLFNAMTFFKNKHGTSATKFYQILFIFQSHWRLSNLWLECWQICPATSHHLSLGIELTWCSGTKMDLENHYSGRIVINHFNKSKEENGVGICAVFEGNDEQVFVKDVKMSF